MIEGNGLTKSFLGWQGFSVSLMITSWIPSSLHHSYMKTLTYQNQQTSTLLQEEIGSSPGSFHHSEIIHFTYNKDANDK